MLTVWKCSFWLSHFVFYFLNLPDNSITEQSDSMETHSSNDDIVLSAHTPTDQSEAFICGEGEAVGVAEAALQDGEKQTHLFQL